MAARDAVLLLCERDLEQGCNPNTRASDGPNHW